MANQGNHASALQWQQMVNSKALSDVSFAVGQGATLIYGHRSIMATASDVFFRMFTGELAPSGSDPVEVPDIDPDTFLEMIKFIYYDSPSITEDNVLKLYYAAEKYNLSRLVDRCLKFLADNEPSTMNIFKANMHYGFERIYEACLKVICANPFKIFKSKEFLELPLQLVEKIARQNMLRCNVDQLMEALQKWIDYEGAESNRLDTLEKLSSIVEKQRSRDFQFRKIVFSGPMSEQSSTEFQSTIKAMVPLEFYGVGVYVGKLNADEAPGVAATFTIHVLIDGTAVCTTEAPFRKDVYIYDCMFEAHSLRPKSKLTLIVKGESNKADSVCYNYGEHACLRWTRDSSVLELNKIDIRRSSPAVAYILYRTKHPECNCSECSI